MRPPYLNSEAAPQPRTGLQKLVNVGDAAELEATKRTVNGLVDFAEGVGATIIGSIAYGSGADGVVEFDGVTDYPAFATRVGAVYTLTRDVFLGDGSFVDNGVTLNTAGFKVFCYNPTTPFYNRGTIACDGKPAAGAVAGGSSALGTLGIGTAGGNGRLNNTGLPGSNQSNVLGDASAAGGAGGGGDVNAGGAGGTYVASATNGGANFLLPMLSGFLYSQTSGGNQAQLSIIGGGAGGGGGGGDAGGTGGGGGGGGGVMVLNVYWLVNDGVIRCLGGNGANATGPGNGGGGGGGGGGIMNVLSRFRSGVGTYLVTGGLPGASVGVGSVGQPGSLGHINQNFF